MVKLYTKPHGLLRIAIQHNIDKGHSLNKSCEILSGKLRYHPSYVYNMWNGAHITNKAAKRIIKALSPKRTRHRIHIEFETLEDKERALALSNSERVRRLLDG